MCFKYKDICHVAVLYLELIAKWKQKMGPIAASWDLDIVECLHGIVSRLRSLRSLLSVMNLENFVLVKKNKIFEWVQYLKQCYPKIHDILYHLTFNEYSIRQHMVNEEEKKKSVNKETLKFFVIV